MFVVGLTGGVGSGKSVVAALFAAQGITVINADTLAREVVTVGSDALKKIAAHFGENILNDTGELKRNELRRIVFAQKQERIWLEQILHPLIARLMCTRIAECQSRYCIVESPLLLETDQHEMVDRVLVIDTSEKTQLQRTLQRDGSDERTVRAIIASQMSRADRLQRADDIIINEGSLEQLESEVASLHRNYLSLAG